MKLLLILNENQPGSHDDVYRALSKLKSSDKLEDFLVYPFLYKVKHGIDVKHIMNEIISYASKFQPTYILWAHTSELKVDHKTFEELKSLGSHPSMGYWDADMYDGFYKPLPENVLNLAIMCDVSFWPGYNKEIAKLKNKGCKDLRYVPLPTDEKRFGQSRHSEIIYDVILIGNNVRSKIPFKSFPGSRERLKVAEFLHAKLKDRFAVYGNGWERSYTKGPVPFLKQGETYHTGRISIGLNNLHADYYFSDRLPISLSSNIIMVHNYEKGMEEVFNKIKYPYLFTNINEAWEIVSDLLSKSQDEIDKIADTYRVFALENLTVTRIFEYMLNILEAWKNSDTKKLASIENPWIKHINL